MSVLRLQDLCNSIVLANCVLYVDCVRDGLLNSRRYLELLLHS